MVRKLEVLTPKAVSANFIGVKENPLLFPTRHGGALWLRKAPL